MVKELKYPTIKFRIKTVYPDFATYYANCKEPIYRKMLEVFQTLLTSESTRTRLVTIGNINNVEFDASYFFEKSNPGLLIDVINPFFESIEDYETCENVMSTYNSFRKLNIN